MEKKIRTNDYYDENLSSIFGFLLDLGLGLLGEVYGIQGTDGVSELYSTIDSWAEDNLSNVVDDDYSRYISDSIYGKGDAEEVSVFMGAYTWVNRKSRFAKESKTTYDKLGYAWKDEIKYMN